MTPSDATSRFLFREGETLKESPSHTLLEPRQRSKSPPSRPGRAGLIATRALTSPQLVSYQTPSSIPRAFYRLQLGADLNLAAVRRLLPYLDCLGISDLYLSPLFRARAGTAHGYDVTNHREVAPEIGTLDDLARLAKALHERGMGILLDVVPNHMGIADDSNAWWNDVLTWGQASAYAGHFDIDWQAPTHSLTGRVLLPILPGPFGQVLESGSLQLLLRDGAAAIRLGQRELPVCPSTWPLLLEQVLRRTDDLGDDDPARMELASIVHALSNLAASPEPAVEAEVSRRRLARLIDDSPTVLRLLAESIVEFNGRPGDAESFNRLEALLAAQHYRLSYWRVATDEINYRRFFDINDLAAIRVEEPRVFDAVHELVLELVRKGWVGRLRVDHPDGLVDPQAYFVALRALCMGVADTNHDEQSLHAADEQAHDPGVYVVAEKILASDEELPADWDVQGTTGYEFLNWTNRLFVDPRGFGAIEAVYREFTGIHDSFARIRHESQRAIVAGAMASELFMLARMLFRIAQEHRHSRDLTYSSLVGAIAIVIASFPVYRTYIRPESGEVAPEDRRRINVAIRRARRAAPTLSRAYFDFLAGVLLLDEPPGMPESLRAQRHAFVQKFQQVTGPVTAKGLEDTALYRYFPLASLNEVGGEPHVGGMPVEEFHARLLHRATHWPNSISATNTHDTKRGEDVRARLNVLSEESELWRQAVNRWHIANVSLVVEIDGEPAPDRNEEYLLYQTLVGTWPIHGEGPNDEYANRIVAYMNKALREAKSRTTWIDPRCDLEEAVERFVRAVLLDPTCAEFRADLDRFVRRIAPAGVVNSLAQTLIKLAAPGVPDIYQGSELWDDRLVDPDNRGAVDFAQRRTELERLSAQFEADPLRSAQSAIAANEPGRAKLLLIWRGLALRRRLPDLLALGRYVPLAVEGEHEQQLLAFGRQWKDKWIVAAMPRLAAVAAIEKLTAGEFWSTTRLVLPPETPREWTHLVTGERFSSLPDVHGGTNLPLAELLHAFPVALLESVVG